MSVAPYTHAAHPVRLGFPNGDLHGFRRRNVTWAAVSVVQADCTGVHHQPAVRPGLHAARPQALDVARRKPRAVRVDPAQVGVGEDVPHELRVLVIHTGGAEQLGDELLQAARVHSSVITVIAHAVLSPSRVRASATPA